MGMQRVKLGQKEFLQAEFGTGDIKIVGAKESEEKPQTMLFLIQDVAKPEDKWNTQPHGGIWITSDEIETDDVIIMRFNKTKSIDMLIETLTEIKESMLGSSME